MTFIFTVKTYGIRFPPFSPSHLPEDQNIRSVLDYPSLIFCIFICEYWDCIYIYIYNYIHILYIYISYFHGLSLYHIFSEQCVLASWVFKVYCCFYWRFITASNLPQWVPTSKKCGCYCQRSSIQGANGPVYWLNILFNIIIWYKSQLLMVKSWFFISFNGHHGPSI